MNTNQNSKICVLGAGAWGTAIAHLLADNGHIVHLWCYEQSVAHDIQNTKYNRQYLPNVKLQDTIIATNNIAHAVQDASFIFQAVPVPFLRQVLQHAKPYTTEKQVWIALSKGVETGTLLLSTDIIADALGQSTKKVALSGPSFAHELANREITAVTLATNGQTVAAHVQKLVTNHYFFTFISDDIIGTQVAGALKNVITLGIGLLQGAGYASNTQAFLLTQGLQEIAQLSVAMGGHRETIYDLCGVGDLVLTATGSLSKNLMFGRKIGAGASAEQLLISGDTSKTNSSVPEGVNTLKSMKQLMHKFNVNLPVCQAINNIIFHGQRIDHIFDNLKN